MRKPERALLRSMCSLLHAQALLIRKCYAQAAMYNRLEELKELVITDPRAISHVRAHASPEPSSCTP